MDIEQAKSVPLTVILNILGHKPTQQKNSKLTYRSIFGKAQKSNLIININTNTWDDSSTEENGDTISLVTGYLKSEGESHAVKDALRWISNMCGYAVKIEPICFEENIQKHVGLIVVNSSHVQTTELIQYIESHGIPLPLAQRYLKEIRIYDKPAGKTFRTLGLRNEDGGYHAFSPSFAGFVGKENITFIRGTVPKPDCVHIFKDIFDFLSALALLRNGSPFEDDVIILNSFANLTKATPYIKGYGYCMAFSWMGNDTPGQKATQSLSRFFKTEPDLVHAKMNDVYAPHESVHAWHMQQTLRPAS